MNYLKMIPCKNIRWKEDKDGNVIIETVNKGFYNKILQILIKKPKTSCIHLDEMGSYIWKIIDGEQNIMDIGECVLQRFGENAKPLYERLCQYIKLLENCGFILMK